MGSARDDRRAAAPAVSSADRAASMSCSVRVLGAAEVDCGGGPIDLGGPKQVTLLVVLALHVNEIVPTDRLIELLSRHRAAHGGALGAGLRVRTRRTFAHLRSPPVIAARAPGYRLEIDADSVDVHQFVQLVAVGLDEVRRGDARPRLRRCDRRAVCSAANHSPTRLRRVRPTHTRRLNELHLDAIDVSRGRARRRTSRRRCSRRRPVGEAPLRELASVCDVGAVSVGRHVQALPAYHTIPSCSRRCG